MPPVRPPAPPPIPDELKRIVEWYHPASDVDSSDPEAPLEKALSQEWATPALVGTALAQLRSALADHDAGRRPVHESVPLYVGLPAGPHWRAWFGYVAGRMAAWRDAVPLPDPEGGDHGLRPRHVSSFTDRPTAQAAATAVLRAHEARLRAWVDGDGTSRLHLYAAVPTALGDVGRVVHRPPPGAPARVEATSACVVLLRRGPGRQGFHIATAYPERVTAGRARERFPDLPLLFGGYFGQDWPALDHSPWSAEAALHEQTHPAVRARLGDQLGALSELDDAELASAVEALGSYVLPSLTRRWVQGLRRRAQELWP